MRKKATLILIACFMLCAVTVYVADAQPNPAGRGNTGRGGASPERIIDIGQ